MKYQVKEKEQNIFQILNDIFTHRILVLRKNIIIVLLRLFIS